MDPLAVVGSRAFKGLRIGVRPVVPVNRCNEVQTADAIGSTDSGITGGRRFAFGSGKRITVRLAFHSVGIRPFILRVAVEGVLSVDAEAGEFGRLVGDGVVHAAVANHERGAFNRAGPGSAERREVARQAVGTVVMELFP